MTTSLKKLLLISITVLLGVMSGGVMALTVTHIAGNEYAYSDGITTTNYDISYVYAAFSDRTQAAQLNSQPWFGNNGVAIAFTEAVGSSLGPTGGNGAVGPYFAVYDTAGMNTSYYWDTKGYYGSTYTNDLGQHNYAIATVNTVGAPEIDGSLAPKVGFLLGCLFLMFGRKKQNSEPMLTA